MIIGMILKLKLVLNNYMIYKNFGAGSASHINIILEARSVQRIILNILKKTSYVKNIKHILKFY